MEIFSNPSASLLFELSMLMIIATFFAYIVKLIRQPLIPAYIITGIILGPSVLGLVSDSTLIRTMSEIGIVFLLFIVGMEMDLKKLKKVGFASVIVGCVQVALSFFLGYVVASLLGFDSFNAIFLGLVVAFSSTMVVIKLLSDRDEIDTLHGRLLIGILLVQDVLVIAAMPFISSMTAFSITIAVKLLIATALLGLFAYLFSRFAIFRIFKFAAKSEELLFLLSLSICFLFVLLAYYFGFSIAIGAFVAGLTLANLPYHFDIIGRVSPLKDFFSTIFFVSLGMQFVLVGFKEMLWPVLALLAIIILLKPIIVTLMLSILGYGRHTPFITGSLLGQTSEFSLIIIIAASSFITKSVFSLTIILTVLTITLTTYILKFDERIYSLFSHRLAFLEKLSIKKQEELEYQEPNKKTSIVLVGCDRMGNVILNNLIKRLKRGLLVIDSNPEVISSLIRKKIQCMYGDISNMALLKRVHFPQARILISTIPNEEDNKRLIKYAKSKNKNITVIVTAERLQEALDLYEAGADFVMLPRIVSGERLSLILDKQLEDGKHIRNIRKEHLRHLLVLSSEIKSG